MARKRALIVDDSKSARVILSRMLEKYDIEVDMSESAEDAIEYLKQNRPDAIFMDQLMPGMDGLQAVQAIKGNPRTATIPIMMYTSQEGELYVGQARALGAMGVLPKQVRPVDVSKVLYELRLLPDRRDLSAPALEPIEMDLASGIARIPSHETPNALGTDWGRKIELVVKDQGVDLRRFVVASLDSFATRIISDTRDIVHASTAPTQEPAAVPVFPAPPNYAPWIAALTLAATAIAFAMAWRLSQVELNKAREQMAAMTAANVELKLSQKDLADTVKDLTSALSTNALASQGTAGTGSATATQAAGTLTRTEPVPYGEAAMERSRIEVLRELLAKLETQGFRGVVKITSYAGIFCLIGNPNDGYAVAPSATPLSKCDTIGNPFDESLSASQRQSVAFANLVTGAKQRSGGAISVAVENGGSLRAAVSYPARTDSTTASEWNKAAAANNRVEFALEPSSG